MHFYLHRVVPADCKWEEINKSQDPFINLTQWCLSKKNLFSAIFALATIQGSIAQELSRSSSANSYCPEWSCTQRDIHRQDNDWFCQIAKGRVNLVCQYKLFVYSFPRNNIEIYSRGATKRLIFSNCKVKIYADKKAIEDLIPTALKSRKEKGTITGFTHKSTKPLTTRLSNPLPPQKGLVNWHIALWQSHGYYYEAKLSRWEWQRAGFSKP